MADAPHEDERSLRTELSKQVGAKETRKIKARRAGDRGIWFGLGLFGIVGWSVAIPTVVCVAVGIWIDTQWPSRFSWTLMLLFLGIVLGCLNAWYWVTKEQRIIEQEEEADGRE